MKLDRGGLILSGIFAAFSLGLSAIALLFSNVAKGQVIFEQLAVAPAVMLLTSTGLFDPLLNACPWMNNSYAFFALSILIMYLIGWGIRRLAHPD